MQEEEKRKKEEASTDDLEKFVNWPKVQKIAYFQTLNLEKFAKIHEYGYTICEIKISNDDKYGFVCNLYSGISK